MRRFCCCPCLSVLGWLWWLICWAFGETWRKAAFYCRFLFVPSLLSSLFLLSVSVSAHGLQCRASGSLALARSLRLWLGWCLLAVLFPLLPSCWLWLFWRFASGLDLWGGSAAGAVSASFRPCVASGAGASSAPVLSERVQAFQCPVLRLWWGWAGRRCRPKGYSRMHNSEMVYLYDMLMAYCTKRCCFWPAIFTFCQDII